jgi:hypothetical protein
VSSEPGAGQVFEFAIKDRTGKLRHLTIPLFYGGGGLPVQEKLRDVYWVAVKMHTEFAATAKLHGVPLPRLFVLLEMEEVIGAGHYEDFNDAYDCAYLDCVMREVAWVEFKRQALVAAKVDDFPMEALQEMMERTGCWSGAIELPEAGEWK